MKIIQPLIATLALSITTFLLFTVPIMPVIAAAEHENEAFVLSGTVLDEKGKIDVEEYINKSSLVDVVVTLEADSKKTMTLRYFEVNIYLHAEASSKTVMLVSAMVTNCAAPGTYATLTRIRAFPQMSTGRIQMAKPNSPVQKAISLVCDVPSSTITKIPGENAEALIVHAEKHNQEVLKTLSNE